MQLFSEFVMFVLGALLWFLAITGRFTLPSGVALWVALGALLIIWGLRVWLRRGQLAQPTARALQWVRGVSLVLAGAVMIAMTWLPFSRAPMLLASVGGILAVRGLLGAALATRLAVR